jgi:hypothetical protein
MGSRLLHCLISLVMALGGAGSAIVLSLCSRQALSLCSRQALAAAGLRFRTVRAAEYSRRV